MGVGLHVCQQPIFAQNGRILALEECILFLVGNFQLVGV